MKPSDTARERDIDAVAHDDISDQAEQNRVRELEAAWQALAEAGGTSVGVGGNDDDVLAWYRSRLPSPRRPTAHDPGRRSPRWHPRAGSHDRRQS